MSTVIDIAVAIAVAAFAGILIYCFPSINAWVLIACIGLALLKAYAIGVAIRWMWQVGDHYVAKCLATEMKLPADATSSDCKRAIFAVLATDNFACNLWIFGVHDWKLRSFMQFGEPRRLGVLVHFLRRALFRVEGLLLLGSVVLLLTPKGSAVLALILAFSMLLLVGIMAAEILVGTLFGGIGYSRYMHFALFESRGAFPGRQKFREIVHFMRLMFWAFIAFGAVCESRSDGFIVNRDGQPSRFCQKPDISTRLTNFAELEAFVCTTVATVGYGDTYPDKPWNRTLVAVIHILSMGMILVLLQVVLSSRDESICTHSPEPNPAST